MVLCQEASTAIGKSANGNLPTLLLAVRNAKLVAPNARIGNERLEFVHFAMKLERHQ
jgi:hypothetical protein